MGASALNECKVQPTHEFSTVRRTSKRERVRVDIYTINPANQRRRPPKRKEK